MKTFNPTLWDILVKAGSGLRFSFGVRAWTEMEIWCVKGMLKAKTSLM